jgi:hypothetical protein
MHFVYKTGNLFRSIRFSNENSSVTKGFHFFELIRTPDFLCIQNAPFKATSSIFNPFWLHLLFFMYLLIFLSYMTLKLKSTTNELWKGWKLAWYHHFTHIAYAKKLRGLRQKLDALRGQNGQSLSKYQGFERKLVGYKGISFFWTYSNSRLFVCSKCTIQSHIINFQPFLTSCVIFHAFTDFFELYDRVIVKHYKWTLKRLKVGMVSSFHPHSMC